MGMMAATSDSSLTTLHAQMKTYKQAGVPFRAIMDDVAQNAEFFAKFSKDGGANILNAALQAKKLGINLSDVASITDSLVDFESSIQKQMEAQVLLGRNINLDRARALAFSGDQVGMMNEVVKQVGGEVEFNKMNVIQRKALADSIGLSVEKMAALVREEQGANKEANKQFGKFIGIGVIIGGIVGLIASLKGVFTGGVSVPKDLLTIAAMTGGGAAIVSKSFGTETPPVKTPFNDAIKPTIPPIITPIPINLPNCLLASLLAPCSSLTKAAIFSTLKPILSANAFLCITFILLNSTSPPTCLTTSFIIPT
jgi:hypothetical protein